MITTSTLLTFLNKNYIIQTRKDFDLTLIQRHKVLVESFGEYYKFVKMAHETNPSTRQRGHGMEHNVHVALHAMDIVLSSDDPNMNTIRLVWMASIGHSLDRLVPRGDQEAFERLTDAALDFIDEDYRSVVRDAILRHGMKNDEGDSKVLMILKDADRVANLGAALAIRSGQFTPDIPPYEMKYLRTANPNSTYRDPTSVVEDLRGCFEWEGWMRTSRGKEVFTKKIGNLRRYLEMVAEEFEMVEMNQVEI